MTKGMDTVGFVFLFPDFVYFLFEYKRKNIERSICLNQTRNNVNSFCSKKIIHFKMIYYKYYIVYSLMFKLYIYHPIPYIYKAIIYVLVLCITTQEMSVLCVVNMLQCRISII